MPGGVKVSQRIAQRTVRRTLRRVNAAVVTAYQRGGLAEIARHVRSDEALEPFVDMYRDLYGRILPVEASKVYRALWKARKVIEEPLSKEEEAQAWTLAIAALLATLFQEGTPMGAIVRSMLLTTETMAGDIVARALAEEALAGELAGILERALGVRTPGRARMIARTELQRIHNTARHTGAEQYQKDAGRRVVKVWRWSHVSRESHAAIDGQRRGLKEDFTVAGFAASYPGDPRLPVGEVAHCQCFVDYEEE